MGLLLLLKLLICWTSLHQCLDMIIWQKWNMQENFIKIWKQGVVNKCMFTRI